MSTASSGAARERRVRDRFWEKVTRGHVDQCWEWRAYLYPNGYGSFAPTRDKRVMAHRYAYELERGPIPDGLTIDHLCRNRACCNPSHMEAVTRGENARRGAGWVQSAAARSARAELACSEGHPRTPEHARRSGKNWRCKTCRRNKRAAGVWK